MPRVEPEPLGLRVAESSERRLTSEFGTPAVADAVTQAQIVWSNK